MTLKENYGEMYGNGKTFSGEVNTNISNHMSNINKNYTNADFNNNNNNNNNNSNTNSNTNSNSNTNYSSTNSYNGSINKNIDTTNVPNNGIGIFNIGIIIFIAIVISAIIYFKDTLIQLYRTIINIPNNNNDIQNEIKQMNKSIKYEKELREEKEKQKILKDKKNKGGVQQLVDKLKYNKDQIANDSGFCYIGYDKGSRHCEDIQEAGICMSGEIFPSLEICMNPELRE